MAGEEATREEKMQPRAPLILHEEEERTHVRAFPLRVGVFRSKPINIDLISEISWAVVILVPSKLLDIVQDKLS